MRTVFVDPGAMRTELSLQVASAAPDGMGGMVQSWTETATVFGHVEPVTATVRFGAGQSLETLTHRITIRWREGVASGMRLERQGRVFEIITVHDPDESGRYLVCNVSEEGA